MTRTIKNSIFFRQIDLSSRSLTGPLTSDFTKGFTSFGPQNNTTRSCRSRCVTVFTKPSCRPASNCGSRLWRVSRRVTMSICSHRSRKHFCSRTSCSASRAAYRVASRWSSLSCASVIGESSFGHAAISPPFLKCDRPRHQQVHGILFLQMMPAVTAGGLSI